MSKTGKSYLDQIEALQKALQDERDNSADWKQHARKWERRAKQTAAKDKVIRAHERTIAKFIERLDDLLTEEN
jgi:predicted RNase H-like nuclease (RuvC/YqgF family)